MEYPVYVTATGQISLKSILELQNQPVSEEQAWALCYQLCTLLSVDQYGRRGEYYTSSRMLQLPGVNKILLTNDGNVCLRIDVSSTDFYAFETEDEMVDYLGRLIYSCLDWGLDSSVERELNETLEVLLCQMTKVNLSQSMQESFQPLCMFSEVIQICENRLYEPAQAARHYRAICSALFLETVELCQYFHNVQRNKDALQKITIEPETRMISQGAAHWHLMEDLSRGVILRPVEWIHLSSPLPVKCSPFQQLLKDINLKRYMLRKVQTFDKTYMSGHNEALLKAISSRPQLKPASERKLKTRPREEASLHELLMDEIRTADRLKLLSSCKKRFSYKDQCFSPLSCPIPFCEDTTEDVSCLFSPISAPDLQEVETEVEPNEPCKERVFLQAANTGVDPELKFLPAISPLDPFCGSSRRKSRSCSLGSHIEVSKLERSCAKVNVPTTIADVIKRRRIELRTLKTIYCDRFRTWRVCSSCSKRSLYFTWHNTCFLCNRVVCPECCIKMHLPYEWCVNLPVSFFKKIVLNKDWEQDVSTFWKERFTWDHTRVPLVLESHVTNAINQPGLAMRDWYSQDICTECKSFLLEAYDSVFNLSPVPGSKEI